MWIVKFIGAVISLASPEIIKQVQAMAKQLKVKAAQTDNPIDDVLAELLCSLLGV